MQPEFFTLERVAGLWEVRSGGRRDPDLTCALRQAIDGGAEGTQRKRLTYLRRFLNFRLAGQRNPEDFLSEPIRAARWRIDELLRQGGCEIDRRNNRIDGSCIVTKSGGSIAALSVGLAALDRFYEALALLGLRGYPSPTKVDGWHRLTVMQRLNLANAIVGRNSREKRYRGRHYNPVGRSSPPLRLEDPVGLGLKLLAAGRARNWPAAIYDLVTVMSDDGTRWIDTAHLTAADWARSSGFGRTLWAPNKGSGDERVKQIVVQVHTVLQLRNSFDEDTRRPDMAELEDLLTNGDWEALGKIYLFPSKHGRPHSYHVFNNHYIRPAVEEAELVISSKVGACRPTAHRLRSARIQAEIDFIFSFERKQEDITKDLLQLQQDVSIKSSKAFYRYVGEKIEERMLYQKIKRFDALKSRSEGLALQTQIMGQRSSPPLSRAQQRQIAMKGNS